MQESNTRVRLFHSLSHVVAALSQSHRAYMRGTFTAPKMHPAPLQNHVATVRDVFLRGGLYHAVEFVAADEQRISLWVAETVNLKVNIK